MPLKDYLKKTLDTVIQKVIEHRTPNFHLAASEIVAENEFDVLLTAAQGFHALAIKYKSHPVLAQSFSEAHDDLLKVLGLLPAEYADEKEKLEMKLEGKLKKNKTDEEGKQLKSLYRDKIYAQRVELKVEAYASNLYKKLESEQGYNQELKQRFKLHLEDNWVEEDLEFLQKHDHETKKEYRMRVELNDCLKVYHQKRKPYEDQKKEIDAEFEGKREQCLINGITDSGQSVAEAIKHKEQELTNRNKDIEERNIHAQALIAKMLKVDVEPLKSKDAMWQAIENNKQSLMKNNDSVEVVEAFKLIESSINADLDRLDTTPVLDRPELLDELIQNALGVCSRHYAKELNQYEQEFDEEIAVIYEPVADELSAIRAQKRQKLKQLDKDLKSMLMEANNYYDEEIGYRKRFLKCEQLNKMFAVQASFLPKLLDEMTENNPAVDTQTLTFFVAMQGATEEMSSLMQKVQVSGEVMANILSKDKELLEPDNISPFLDKVVKHVLDQVEDNEKELLTEMGLEGQQVFANLTQRMLRCCQMTLPIELEENDYVPTLLDFMPDKVPEPIEQYDQKDDKDKDLFYYVQKFKEGSKLGRIQVAYQLYGDLAQARPELSLEEHNDPALVLLNSLEDNAAGVLLNLLPVIERTYSVLQKNIELNPEQNKQIESVLEQVARLKSKRITLNAKFQALLSTHEEQRAAYKKNKKLLAEKEQNVESLNVELSTLKDRINKKREAFSNKKVKIIEKILDPTSSKKYTSKVTNIKSHYETNLEQLQQKYASDFSNLEERLYSQINELKTNRDSAQADVDKEIQDEINSYIKDAYALEKSAKSSFPAVYYYRYYYSATQEDLDGYLKDNSDKELKDKIKAAKDSGAERLKRYQSFYDGQIEDLEESYEQEEEELFEKFNEKKQSMIEHKEIALKEIEPDAKALQIKLNTLEEKHGREISSLKDDVLTLKATLSNAKKEKDEQKKYLLNLSRSYSRQLEDFKNLKTTLQEETNKLIKEALDIDPGEQLDLIATRMIIGRVYSKAQMFRHIALIKQTVMDQKELGQLNREDIMGRHEIERQVREISPASELEDWDRRYLNVSKLVSDALVEKLSKAALSDALVYAENLEGTILGEKKFVEQQKLLNQYSKSPSSEQSRLHDEVPKESVPNPYQYPRLERFVKNITQSIDFFSKALIKGFAYAIVDKIASSLMLRGAISEGEHEVDVMFAQLQSITHIGHRQKALGKIKIILQKLDDKNILDSDYNERFEVEDIKQRLLEAIDNKKKENQSGVGWRFLLKGSSANARLNQAIKDIQPIKSYLDLSKYIQTINQDQKELFDIIKSFKKEVVKKVQPKLKEGTRLKL